MALPGPSQRIRFVVVFHNDRLNRPTRNESARLESNQTSAICRRAFWEHQCLRPTTSFHKNIFMLYFPVYELVRQSTKK